MIPGLAALMVAATSTVGAEGVIDALVAGRGPFPSLRAVQAAAVAALDVAPEGEARSWGQRARWRGLVPRIDAALGSDQGLDVKSSVLDGTDSTTREGRRLGLDLRARWELGEIVFNDLELRANREALARAAALHLARERVTKLYFERLEIWLRQRSDKSLGLALAAARVDGLIRAATGGRLDMQERK